MYKNIAVAFAHVAAHNAVFLQFRKSLAGLFVVDEECLNQKIKVDVFVIDNDFRYFA